MAKRKRAHPDLNQGPADLQSAALTTELCTQMTTHRILDLTENWVQEFTPTLGRASTAPPPMVGGTREGPT